MTIRVSEVPNRTLATAAEVAERKAMQSEPPTKPTPRVVFVDAGSGTYGRLFPTEAEIASRATGCANVDTAVESLKSEYRPKHRALLGTAPERFQAIGQLIAEGSRLLDEARDQIAAGFERLNEIKALLEQRGNQRLRVRQLREEQATLEGKLADPTNCNLPPEVPYSWSRRLAFIPNDIKAAEEQIAKHSARLAEIREGYDLQAIIRHMDEETTMPGGGHYHDQQHVHDGIRRGDIAPD